ncbi:hypothetical protein [Alistipes sp.]|uniref:hypothetical protein n=1 Tax=Alistipes sp. TaxID=1872444 RepID=UPI001329A2FA|nr:hypothetical protein [Alistipes sp.]MUU02973.1 hypothetical protein [Alistipes sp.]
MVSLLYTNNMAKRLKEKEQHDVALWAHAMERANRNVMGGSMEDPLITDIVSNGNNIPFIMTNENLEVLNSTWFPKRSSTTPTGCAGRSTNSRPRTPAHGAFLVVQRPLPHHLLRAIGTAQIALLLPMSRYWS